jgi:hypothetical protein
VEGLLDILKELRLGHTRITDEENVEVASDSMLALDVLGLTAEHGEANAGLDVAVLVDRGRDRVDEDVSDVRVLRELADLVLLF